MCSFQNFLYNFELPLAVLFGLCSRSTCFLVRKLVSIILTSLYVVMWPLAQSFRLFFDIFLTTFCAYTCQLAGTEKTVRERTVVGRAVKFHFRARLFLS